MLRVVKELLVQQRAVWRERRRYPVHDRVRRWWWLRKRKCPEIPSTHFQGMTTAFVKGAWCANRKWSMDELECANLRVVVPGELD